MLYLQHEQQVLEKTAKGIYNSVGKKHIQLPTKIKNDLSWNLENVHFNIECVENNFGVLMDHTGSFLPTNPLFTVSCFMLLW